MRENPSVIDQEVRAYISGSKRYLVFTFSDNSRFALDTDLIKQELERLVKQDAAWKLAAKFDLEPSEALKLVKLEHEVEDQHITGFSYTMSGEWFMANARQLDNTHPVVNFDMELERCPRVWMTEQELDRYKLNHLQL